MHVTVTGEYTITRNPKSKETANTSQSLKTGNAINKLCRHCVKAGITLTMITATDQARYKGPVPVNRDLNMEEENYLHKGKRNRSLEHRRSA